MNTANILRSTSSPLPHQLFFRATSSVASTSCNPRRSYASRSAPAALASMSANLTARPQTSPAKTDARLHDAGQPEGPHPRDQTPIVPSSSARSDSASLDLSTPFHGPWTLFSPVYTPSDLAAVRVVRRPATCFSDRLAAGLVAGLRKGFDIASGYKHVPMPTEAELKDKTWTTEELRKRGSTMTEDQWLMRILFLESIAGVPGMVAGALRHLHSLRLMRRDGGWIHTLLEEAENERMHLMTFMAVAKPSRALRALILVGQGVFYNAFFLAYLLSPRVAHRFVGCLEEEAVVTYTRAIAELRAGHLPLWEETPAPEIARSYWRLDQKSTMLDVLEAVRSDEANHRFVNHTLAELQPNDFNPFAQGEPPALIKGTVAGFSRDEAARFARDTRLALEQKQARPEQELLQQGFGGPSDSTKQTA